MQATAASFLARPLPRLRRIGGWGADAAAVREGVIALPLRLRGPRCSISLSIGAGAGAGAEADHEFSYEHVPVFPRYRIRDPYKLLGVDRDASEEEIRGAKNFLIQQYAGHEPSEEAIEGAYEKIIMKSYQQRKKTKINLKTKLKKRVEESPSWVKALLGCFEVPSMDIISRRLFFFAFIAGWSIATSAENGPAFQLAISLFSCIYFLNEKMKNLLRASTTGFGILVGGWIIGSLLVPLVPTFIIPPSWSLELLTSLVAYIFLFLGSTFLK
ncbi:Protein CHAPERONE-LIKE PROTEIN OF POR1, chloroplastic [Zea mays]|uniref:Protein CHAPERONE-LIKE PROTEIN OF POR1, chloroplastic n=1 Tax=Zea mays TaxID=4577 RepID=A0A3L6E2L3_MAIZE|nr:Protein CHAPERONE-LIKE PROTEIN OF POR1, chloroplastic [Zea mays]